MCSFLVGLSAAMTAASGYASYQAQKNQAAAQAAQLEAQGNAYRAQADAAARNAAIENRRQETIADKAAEEQRQNRARFRIKQGEATAQAGALGLGTNGNTSVLDILSGNEQKFRRDSMNLLTNQREENYESRITESNFLSESKNANASAGSAYSQARAARQVSPWPTILGTGASIIGQTLPYTKGYKWGK